MKKLSILIPCYNQENIIGTTLKYIAQVDPSLIDVIIVDDASTDNSVSVIKQWVAEFENVKLIESEVNCGIGVNRNKLINLASGEFSCFVDADDPQSCDYYKTILSNLDSNKDVYKIRSFTFRYDFFSKKYKAKDFVNAMTFIFKTDFLKLLKFNEALSWGEDYEFNVRYYKKLYENVAIVNVNYDYNCLTSNLSLTTNKSLLETYNKELKLSNLIVEYLSDNKSCNRLISHKLVDLVVLESILDIGYTYNKIKFLDLSFKFKILYSFVKLCDILNLNTFKKQILLKKHSR